MKSATADILKPPTLSGDVLEKPSNALRSARSRIPSSIFRLITKLAA